MKIRDRVRELRRVRAGDLRPNPRNWRTHPESQANALRGILAEIGYADALLCVEESDGSLMLVDGHLRAEVTPDAMVPVLILDLNPAEVEKVLATLDPLAAMAGTDQDALEALLATVETDSEAVKELLREIGERGGILPPAFSDASRDDQGDLDRSRPVTCPECGHQFDAA